MGCNFEFSTNTTSDSQSSNFTDDARSVFREQAICELQQQSGGNGGSKVVSDAAAPLRRADQKELEFPDIYNGPITRDIREVPLNPSNTNATDMVLGVPNGDDAGLDELNKLTSKMFEEMLNPESGPKSLTGPGGTLEEIIYDGKVIRIPDDVIDCGFGDKSDEIQGAGRLTKEF